MQNYAYGDTRLNFPYADNFIMHMGIGWTLIPVCAPNRPMLSLVLLHPSAELLLDGLIDSLDPSIGLRMPWRSPHHNAFWPYLFDF